MEQRFDAGEFNPELRWNTGNWASGRADFGSNAEVLARKLAIEATAEVALVYDFAHTANALGLALPVTGQLPPDPNAADWLHAANEPLLGDDLLRWQHLPELLSLAQHHRVPTRLLDWSMDPIASAFFAATDPAAENGPGIAVFGLHTTRAKQVALEPTSFAQLFDQTGPDDNGPQLRPALHLVQPIRTANPNLTAQSGLFTAISASGVDFMRRDGRRVDLEALVREAGLENTVLRRISLPVEHVDSLRKLLGREGITRALLMPSLDNVAADVLHRWGLQW